MHLEHRQVIHRPLNDFFQSPLPCWSLAGTVFATEDGFESGHVQHSARAVNQSLIDLVQLAPAFGQEIVAVFQLVAGVRVVKARAFLLLTIECKTQAGRVHPAVHHPRQTRQAPGTNHAPPSGNKAFSLLSSSLAIWIANILTFPCCIDRLIRAVRMLGHPIRV